MPPKRAVGVIYTKPWAVDLMLDLLGYTVENDLGAETIVEPGCGDGAFLSRIVPRLLESAQRHGRAPRSLTNAIRASDIDTSALGGARQRITSQLIEAGVKSPEATRLAGAWILEADFLLDPPNVQARWVVGNPPYVRVEESDAATYRQYRDRWSTMSGRADIYIGFFQAGLSLLKPGGALCFICADRWMHNQYGSSLRKHVIDNFAMRLLLEMHDSDVFDVRVAAYPAITLMERREHDSTVLATARSEFDDTSTGKFIDWWKGDRSAPASDPAFTAATIEDRFQAEGSWPSGPPERLQLISNLESRFPSLADVDITIGVGIATGADRVYVVDTTPDVEADFLKKVIGPADIRNGNISWSGRWLVSPWKDGQLVDIDHYPKLKRYFIQNSAALKARYVATKNKTHWWRTIDRPPSDEYHDAKLIVADINDRIEPALDQDGYWPLHSAYYIRSDTWDLEVLGGYLLSDVAAAFVEAYSVKMANGHLRISAQYLKRIRLPKFDEIGEDRKVALAQAFKTRDRTMASGVVRALLDLE